MTLSLRDASGNLTTTARRALVVAIVLAEAAAVLGVAAHMYDVRMTSYEGLIEPGDDGNYYFIGTDPYYHLRAVIYSVENFPGMLRWDPFTQFPFGTDPGQFGTLFDVLIAAAVLVTVGPEASVKQIADVATAAPAAFGAFLVIPLYLLARVLTGRIGALLALALAAALPGEYLIRSIAGYVDHHVAENLFLVLAALGLSVALYVARRDVAKLRRYREEPKGILPTGLATVAAGIAFALYIWVWPPGLLFYGVALIALVLHVLLDHVTGRDPLPVAVAGAGTFLVAFAGLIPFLVNEALASSQWHFFTTFSRLHPAFALASATIILAAYALHVASTAYRLPRFVLPAGGAAAALLAIPVMGLVFPVVWASLRWGIGWITGIGVTQNILTIAEARATDMATIEGSYGFLYYTAILGMVPLAYRIARRGRAEDTLLLVWSLVFLLAAFTQVRFTYYFAINVALLNAVLVASLADLRLGDLGAASGSKGKGKGKARRRGKAAGADVSAGSYAAPVAAILVAALLVVPAVTTGSGGAYAPAWDRVAHWPPDTNLQIWTTELEWLRDATPSTAIDLTATYPRGTAAPDGAYGVLAWWDYGHYIQVIGERPPVANPFQQAAPFASLYFTSQSEAAAEVLVDEYTKGRGVRYVMIDDESAAGKFSAITVWAHMQDSSRGTLYGELGQPGGLVAREEYDLGGTRANVLVMGPEYRNSMMGRLYDEDGVGLERYRLVREHTSAYSVLGNIVDRHNNNELVCMNTILNSPSRYCPFAINVQQHVNLLGTHTGIPATYYTPQGPQPQDGRFYAVDVRVQSALKTFERVEGAIVEGHGAEPGETVILNLGLRTPQRDFQYRIATTADDQGRWSARVPYSTTDPVPVSQGGTALDVTSRGPYEVRAGGELIGYASVPDAAVLQGNRVQFTQAG